MIKIDYDTIESVVFRKRTESALVEWREQEQMTFWHWLFFVEPAEEGFYYSNSRFRVTEKEKYLFDFGEKIVYLKPAAVVTLASGNEIRRYFDTDRELEEFLDHLDKKTNFRLEGI